MNNKSHQNAKENLLAYLRFYQKNVHEENLSRKKHLSLISEFSEKIHLLACSLTLEKSKFGNFCDVKKTGFGTEESPIHGEIDLGQTSIMLCFFPEFDSLEMRDRSLLFRARLGSEFPYFQIKFPYKRGEPVFGFFAYNNSCKQWEYLDRDPDFETSQNIWEDFQQRSRKGELGDRPFTEDLFFDVLLKALKGAKENKHQ